MRFFSFAPAAALAAFSLFALTKGTESVRAQTPPQASPSGSAATPLPKPRTWMVDNKDKLVTVREKDGAPLFAQVITTPNLVIELNFAAATKKVTLTLRDEKGKRLYDMTFPHLEHGLFNFNADFQQDSTTSEKTGGTAFTFTPSTETAPDAEDGEDGKLIFVLNPDDWPVRGDLTTGKTSTHIERTGTQLTLTSYEDGKKTSEKKIAYDEQKKTVTTTDDGKEVATVNYSGENTENATIRMRDAAGEVTQRIVKQDGKTYTQFTVGERKVLVEGDSWKFTLTDGVLTLIPTGTPPAKTVADK